VESTYFAITSRPAAISKSGVTSSEPPTTAAFLDRSAPSWMGDVVECLAAPEMMDLFLANPATYVRNGGSTGWQTMRRIIRGEVCTGDGPVQSA
jgi:hypothetical protein